MYDRWCLLSITLHYAHVMLCKKHSLSYVSCTLPKDNALPLLIHMLDHVTNYMHVGKQFNLTPILWSFSYHKEHWEIMYITNETHKIVLFVILIASFMNVHLLFCGVVKD